MFVRSTVARARLLLIDTSESRPTPRVVAIHVHDDLAPLVIGSLQPSIYEDLGVRVPAAPKRPLPQGDVRFVGEPIALVIATSHAVADDAAERVVVEYELLPPVVDYKQSATEPVHMFSNACHACIVEVDVETGKVTI